ncbi:MAG: winged helix-turn-helix domain-containing protein [Pirellulales bacterium]
MAKSKLTNSGKRPAAVQAKRKASTASESRSVPPAAKATASGPRVLSSTEIGHVAGEVWGLLTRDGGQTLAAIKKSIDAPPDVVAAALGWLAREDKLEFSTKGRQIIIALL